MRKNKPSTAKLPSLLRLLCAVLDVACQKVADAGAGAGLWWSRSWLRLAGFFAQAAKA